MNGELLPRGASDWLLAQPVGPGGLSRKEQRQLAHDEAYRRALQEQRFREALLKMRHTAQAAQVAILAQDAINRVEDSVQTDDPNKRWRTGIIANAAAATLAHHVEDVGY